MFGIFDDKQGEKIQAAKIDALAKANAQESLTSLKCSIKERLGKPLDLLALSFTSLDLATLADCMQTLNKSIEPLGDTGYYLKLYSSGVVTIESKSDNW